jgi:hypothetical protein
LLGLELGELYLQFLTYREEGLHLYLDIYIFFDTFWKFIDGSQQL